MSVGKTVLIVGAVGVGAFVVYKIVTPTPAQIPGSSATSLTTAGISGLVTGIGNLFKGTPSPSGGIFGTAGTTGQGAVPTFSTGGQTPAQVALANSSPYGSAPVVEQDGSIAPAGTFGPSVPTNLIDQSSSGDGLIAPSDWA